MAVLGHLPVASRGALGPLTLESAGISEAYSTTLANPFPLVPGRKTLGVITSGGREFGREVYLVIVHNGQDDGPPLPRGHTSANQRLPTLSKEPQKQGRGV